MSTQDTRIKQLDEAHVEGSAARQAKASALDFLKGHIAIMRPGLAPRPLTDDEARLVAEKAEG